MPFEEDELEIEDKKDNLGKVSNKKSIFDNSIKKQNINDFKQNVQKMQDKNFSYKERTNDLAIKFKKIIESKVLPENKNIFILEQEKQILAEIVSLASEIDNDENEQIGIGSLSWIVQLLKTSLYQRDRINKLEYSNLLLNKKFEELNSKFLKIANEPQALDSKNKDV